MKVIFNTDSLTPMQKGRLDKALQKQYRYSEGVFTQKEYIEKFAVDKKIYKGGIFNRTHFNRLDNEGQEKYEANLKKKVEYEILLQDGCSTAIPKIVYEVLEFKEK